MYTFRGLGQSSSLVSAIAAAITQMEGFYPGSLAYRNNNPGNLSSGPGMTGTSGGFAVFPDLATGQAALENQIQLNIDRGLSLDTFFAGNGDYPGYAPKCSDPKCAGNDPTAYANFVGSQVGIDTSTPLSQLESDLSPAPSSDDSGVDLSGDSDGGGSGGISTGVILALVAASVGLVWWAAA